MPSAAAKPQTRLTQDPGFVAGASRMGTCPKCEGAPAHVDQRRAAERGPRGGRRGRREPGGPARVSDVRGRDEGQRGTKRKRESEERSPDSFGARADFGFTAHGMLPTAVPFDDDTTRGGRSPHIAGTELGVPATGGKCGGIFGGFATAYIRGSASAISRPIGRVRLLPTPRQMVRVLDAHVVGQRHAKRALAVAVYNHYARVIGGSRFGSRFEGAIDDCESNPGPVFDNHFRGDRYVGGRKRRDPERLAIRGRDRWPVGDDMTDPASAAAAAAAAMARRATSRSRKKNVVFVFVRAL